MNELLKKDLAIKSLSVFFAVVLWFFVSYTLNPPWSSSIDIPLRIVNENTLQDKDLVIRNRNIPGKISVTVKGKKNKVDSLSFTDFDAVLDFSKIKDADTKQLDVDVYLSKADISIESVRPKTIAIQLERIGKNPFTVEVVPVGKVKEGYKIIRMSAAPQTVSVTGLDSLIKSVASVRSYVDVNNLDRNLTVKKECKVYNKEGKEITELGKDLNVEVKLEVAKEVGIVPTVKGNPAKNFAQSIVSVEPAKVLIEGPPELLANINELPLETVDIENSNQTVKAKRAIKLPEGIKLVDSPKDVEISVTIEEILTRDMVITKDDISLMNTEIDNSLKYEILTTTQTISVRGMGSELKQLDIGKLKPSVDVGGLREGTHKIPMKVILPGTVKLIQDYTVEVKIDKRE